MSDSIFWRIIAVAFVVGIFYLGSVNDSEKPVGAPVIGTRAFADDPVARDRDAEYVFTASQDGRKIYMWQRVGSNKPKFVGESDAVLSQ